MNHITALQHPGSSKLVAERCLSGNLSLRGQQLLVETREIYRSRPWGTQGNLDQVTVS